MAGPARYQVSARVQGELSQAWAPLLAGLELAAQPDGTTVISGELPDEAAVHGLVAAIRDLGLSLVSLEARAIVPATTSAGGMA
ncbi:MAG: hypothetical protein MUE82_12720 [Chloroflexi bacterium]|nr:hypothetical protein [Chloroflexota bacterium]